MRKHIVEDGFGVYTKSKGWQNKNLAFLVDFMRELTITTRDIADAMHYTRSAVTRWLSVDDMRLSKVMEIAEAFGYEFIITYTVPYASAHNTNLLIDRYAVNGEKSLAEKRMTFLRFAIAQANITASDVAAAVGLQRQGVQRWFRQDDVNVRYIYELAEAMNWKVNIHFKRKEQAEASDCADTEETTKPTEQ